MRIGIDVRTLQSDSRYRGIGKALESLLTALLPLVKKDEIVFYIDEGFGAPKIIDLYKNAEVRTIKTARIGRMKYIRSFIASYPIINPTNSDSLDVLLQYDASFGVPKKIKTVLVFHDLIPYIFRKQEKKQKPTGMRRIKNSLSSYLYWKKYLRSLRYYKNAAKIIAISRCSKKDLHKYIPATRQIASDIIYHGIRKSEKNDKFKMINSKFKDLAKQPYILYVGGIDYRKNISRLLQDFFICKINHPSLNLIAIGKEFSLNSQVADTGWTGIIEKNVVFKESVITPGFISDAELAYLYKHAEAFVFPSKYEGFGLPILEAMQAGCPVIAYNNSSIPEVAGNAALLVKDGESLAPYIEKLINDPSLRREMIQKGKKQVKKFTWEKTARETLKILHEVGRSM